MDQAENNGSQQNPNIIVILADDMGFSDIGCYGSEIRTPNLDALAAGGVRFTQMYNCARCCPTRASLLTGLYPHQTGIGHMVGDSGHPGYRGFLNEDCVTIAEALKQNGYRTYLSGKWHVGGGYAPNRPDAWTPGAPGFPIPVQRGFDHHYGMLGGAGSYFHPPYMIEDETLIATPGADYYFTDAVTDRAIGMIEEAKSAEDPFFLYLAYTAPHWPLHALPEDIARYEGMYGSGWESLRCNRHEELKGKGIVDRRWDISLRDENSPPWQDSKHKDWEALRMAVYAAQIDRMDQGIGRVVETLRAKGILENTLILFLSDNGGCAEFLAEDGGKPEKMRYNIPLPDGRSMHVGNTPSLRPGPDQTYMSYDLPWANASNSPFRLFKHWVHEGGISTPLIAHWPNMIRDSGSLRHAPCHVIDIMATCLDVSGTTYPSSMNGRQRTPVEGESLLPAFRNHAWRRERPIFFEHEGNRAVRTEEWKLVSKHPGDWELYNMLEDRTEGNDLSSRESGRCREMVRMYEEWASRCNVLPWPLNRG